MYKMYKLTLSSPERDAFYWVGHRYASSGDEMMDLIRKCEPSALCRADGSEADSADECEDITYSIPEHIAWQMKQLAESEDFAFPCFSDELAEKLQNFCDSII